MYIHLNVCIAGTYCCDLHKMIYFENRRYLPPDSSLRKQKRGFPTQNWELQPPPAKKSFDVVKQCHYAFDETAQRYS